MREALKAMPQARGIALEAFGEFSESINLLIDGLAHEGDLKNCDNLAKVITMQHMKRSIGGLSGGGHD